MPIRPENRNRYPAEWPQIRAAILERARYRCEGCSVPDYAVGYRDAEGRFIPLRGSGPCDAAGQGEHWPSGQPLGYAQARAFADLYNCCTDERDADGNRWIVVVLTVAHLNHQPEDCRPENLRAFCQACHSRHDRQARQAGIRERRRQTQIPLALEPINRNGGAET